MSYSAEAAFLSNLIYDNGRVNQNEAQSKTRYVGPSGARWELRAYESDGNGYQGAIFKNVDTGEVMLVNRGTEIGAGGGSNEQ